MKPKTLILMVVAVGCGLVAALLVKYGMSKDNTPKEQYLAANEDMGPGTKLDNVEKQFHPKDYLPGTAPPGAMRNDQESRDKLKASPVLVSVLAKDEVLTLTHITDAAITSKLEKGEMAMAVPVTVNNAVAGFLAPEVHVDLLLNYSKGTERIVKNFMRDVRVLAVNQQFTKPVDQPAGAPTVNLATITVAVDSEKAGVLTWAMGQGSLTLLLRKPGDKNEDEIPEIKGLEISKKKTTGKKDEKEKIWVAKSNIAKGAKIEADLFEEKELPKTEQNSRFYKASEELPTGKILVVELEGGEPLEKRLVMEPTKPAGGATASVEMHQMIIMNGTKEPIIAKFQRVVGSAAWNGSGLPEGLRSNMTVPAPDVPPPPPTAPAPGTITITPPAPSGAAPRALPTLGAGAGLNGN